MDCDSFEMLAGGLLGAAANFGAAFRIERSACRNSSSHLQLLVGD